MATRQGGKNLIVLGMHRSGTSMIAGGLASAGLYAGEPAEMMPAGEDNPRGFWERRDVVELNDQLLTDAGGSWFNPVMVTAANKPAAIETIVSRLDAAAPWLLKDPRLALTWPAWQAPLSDAVRLWVYRSPLAVARSLQRRHDFPLEYGLALWEFYNHSMLEQLLQSDFISVSYEAFAADPGAAWSELSARLGAAGVVLQRDPDPAWYESALDHAVPEDPAQLRLSPSQLALHEYCIALCETGSTAPPLPERDPVLPERLAEYARAFDGLAGVAALRAERAALREERDLARAQQGELDERYHALADAYQVDSKELAELRAIYRELEREHTVARQEQVAALEQVSGLRAKSDYLFEKLDTAYLKLLGFDESVLGRGLALASRLYKILTLRAGVSTAYEDVLADAGEHFREFGSAPAATRRSRWQLGWAVLVYVLRHPVSSIRSFSWHRLRRAVSVFLGSNREDLSVWVGQRFPELDEYRPEEISPELDESLDALQLEFPAVAEPRVSIVVPVFNQYRMTVYCLRSLLAETRGVSYEVIIADDASTDLTATIGQRVAGVTVLRAENNQGFLRNCNAAARAARGEYILFLNNDTAFTPGWLEALVAVPERDATVGVVGPMLLFGNGRLQEAGGIVWQDASGWNYGRMDDAARPEYNYLKDVDYVSGACLLIRAALWQSLGGFDERYCPAYYEDTDICFAAREAGFRVVYQPFSRVYHFEGISHGTDLAGGIKQYQLDNQSRFRDKWQPVLDAAHFPNGEQVFFARDRSAARRTVLVVDHYVPSFDKDAGSRSTWMYLQLMVELGYNVKFIGANFFPHQPYTRALQAAGIEVLVGEYMARNLSSWLTRHAADIDVIYIHRPHVAEQFMDLFAGLNPRPKLVYFGHDLHFLRFEREHALKGDAELLQQAAQWKARELDLFGRMDKVYYPSQVEIDVIRDLMPGVPAEAIPLYVLDDAGDADYEFAARRDILFVAGFNHPPNVDGLCWFVDEVMPRVWRECPDLVLHVVGSNAPAAVTALAGEKVVVHGYLSDEELADRYAHARMVAVPLRFGAGVKGKVLEALQHGLPLVTTSVGAEGLPEAETVFNICDTAEEFAAALVAVERGDADRLQRLAHYRDYLHKYFSKQRAGEILFRDFGEPCKAEEASA